jgi:hypothetical protein
MNHRVRRRPAAFLAAASAMLSCLAVHSIASAAEPPEARLPRPTPEQAAWQDLEPGLFIAIWFGGGVLDPIKGGPDMLPILRMLQPEAIVFQGPAASIRWIGNEDGVAPDPCRATVPDVRDHNGPGSPDGPKWLPGECDVPIRRAISFTSTPARSGARSAASAS